MSKRILFFAKPADIAAALCQFEELCEVKYALVGIYDERDPDIFYSYIDIDGLGASNREFSSGSRTYLISERDQKLTLEGFKTSDGARHWDLNNGLNSGTFTLTPAGDWNGMILAGTASTVHDDRITKHLMNAFVKALKRAAFVKINGWWLGVTALDALKSGVRLSKTAEQSPPEFDFRLA